MAFKFWNKRNVAFAALTAVTLTIAACGGTTTTEADPEAEVGAEGEDTEMAEGGADVSGDVLIDGSSTVFPIAEAMAEEFMAATPGTNVTVGTSGSGGGFEKFCAGETDVSNASRPIEEDEIANCEANGIEFVELAVATDALTVVVNPENDWAQCMTIEELQTMWAPESQGTVTNWNQVNPEFPDQELLLYGPGTDSGTFDYFTETVNGDGGASRGDYTASEDDNQLVQGVEGDPGALAYFGFAYYIENQDQLTSVEIDGGEGCVAPSQEAVLAGEYTPFSRPLFMYVKVSAMEEKPQVAAFVDFVLDPANRTFVDETGYVALNDDQYAAEQAKVQ